MINFNTKGRVASINAVKILALPRLASFYPECGTNARGRQKASETRAKQVLHHNHPKSKKD